jgi:hypothetical protein
MIIIVKCAECFSISACSSLSQTFRVLLAGYSRQPDLPSDQFCPKNCCMYFEVTTNRGVYTPYPVGTAFAPTIFPLLPAYLLPFLFLHCPSPPFLPISRSIFFLSSPSPFPPSSSSHPILSPPRFPYPLKRGPGLSPG